MHSLFSHFLSTAARPWRTALAVSVILSAAPAFAADAAKGPPGLSEKANALFEKVTPLTKDAKWKEIVELIDAAIPQFAPDSVDLSEVLYSKGIALLQIDDYAHALEPLENSLRISDAHKGADEIFLGKNRTMLVLDILAKLYAQEGQNAKTPAAQGPYYAKSLEYLKRLIKETPKPKLDTRQLYATILLASASVDPDKVDPVLIKEVRSEVENILYSTVKPTETIYGLLLSAIQQSSDYEKLAQVLELMVAQYPTKERYWSNLMQSYNQLAQNNTDKDPEKMRQFYTRAINTIERAQAYGFLKTPRDQFNLVTMYSIVGQFGRSTEILHAGLRNGTIESDPRTWIQLEYAYQMAHMDLEAIAALKEGGKLFPKAGLLDYTIGNIYYSPVGLDDPKNAVVFFKSALQKQEELAKSTNISAIEKQGELDKSKLLPTYRIIAYISMELGQLDEALSYVEKAEKLEEGAKDPSVGQLKNAIKNAIEKAKENTAPTPAP